MYKCKWKRKGTILLRQLDFQTDVTISEEDEKNQKFESKNLVKRSLREEMRSCSQYC